MRAQKRPRPASPSSLSQNLNSEQNDEFGSLNLSQIRKEVRCPICLGIPRKTRTSVECLHRFCKECIETSLRTTKRECPLCRTHFPSRRSLKDDPQFDALIAALYPDIDKYEKEDGSSKKQIQDSTAQTSRQQSEALGRKRLEKATASASAQIVVGTRRNNPISEHQGSVDEGGVEHASGTDFFNSLSTDQIGIKLNNSLSNSIDNGALAPGTQPSSSNPIEKLLQVYPATSCPPSVPKSLHEACSSLCQAMSQVVEAAGSEGEKARKKVEELQLQVSTKDVELNRYKLLAEAACSEGEKARKKVQLQVSMQDADLTRYKLLAEAACSEGKKARKKVEELQVQVSTKDAELTRYKLLAEAACSEGEKARKKVEELQVQVSMQDAELTQMKLLAEDHKNEVDALTEELKMSTDQVLRLDQEIEELKAVEEEQASRLAKEMVDRFFTTGLVCEINIYLDLMKQIDQGKPLDLRAVLDETSENLMASGWDISLVRDIAAVAETRLT